MTTVTTITITHHSQQTQPQTQQQTQPDTEGLKKMAPICRVAVAQWYIKNLAIEENHKKACAYIHDAASQGAELVVLPEYLPLTLPPLFITSCSTKLIIHGRIIIQCTSVANVAGRYHLNGFAPEDPLYIQQTEKYGPYLKAYQDLARKLGICLVPGTIVERHLHSPPSNTNTTQPHQEEKNRSQPKPDQNQEKPLLYNTAYFISPTGTILSSYRKKNIWHPERPYLTSSGPEPHEVFDTPIGKVGLLICWDLAFPEAFRELIANGAEIIIVPTFCDDAGSKYDASPAALAHNQHSESLLLTSTLTTRAFENTCAVIFANVSAGPGSGDRYMGLSRAVLPVVGVVGSMGDEEGVMVVGMDMGVVRVAEECYRVRGDLGGEGWYYVYRHSLR